MRKLIGYDLKKLTYQKIFLVFFAVLLVCNGIFVYREISEKQITEERELTAFIEEYRKDPEAMEAYMADYQALFALYREASSRGEQAERPRDVYSSYDGALFSEFAALRDLNESYDALLKKAKKASEGMLKEYAYLGYDEGSFEVVYQTSVLLSYGPLEGLRFPLENLVGYDIFFEYNGFCVFLLLGVALLGIQIVTEERSASMLEILRTAKRGRYETMVSKLVVGFTVTLFACVLFNLSTLIVIAMRVGLHGAGLPIQMVTSMQLCPYALTVAEGILMSLMIQIFTSFAFLVCVMLIAVILQHPLAVFASVVALIGTNFAIANYQFLDHYSFLKNINLFWCLDGARILSVYRGVKIWGRCVAMFPAWLFLYLFLSIGVGVMTILLFANRRGTGRRRARRRVALRIPVGRRISYPFGLYRFEVKKVCTLLTAVVLLVSLALMIRVSDGAYRKQRTYDMNLYSEYMTRLEGAWTQEKHAAVEEDYLLNLAIIGQSERMRAGYENGTVTREEYNRYLADYFDAEIRQPTLTRIYERSLYLRELNAAGRRADFYDDTGWRLLSETNLAWVMSLATVIVCADIFSLEYRSGFEKIRRVTKRGGRPTVISKLATAASVGAVLGALSELCQLLFVVFLYGISGVGCSAMSMELASSLSVGGYFLMMAIRNVALYVVLALLTAGVSRVTKRLIPTLAVMTVLVFAPMVFSYFGITLFEPLSFLNLFAR